MHHHLFSDKSELYKTARPNYPSEIFEFLARQCHETQLAWDCACGNGQAAIGLADEFDLIYARDVSNEQIHNAQAHPRIRYSAGPCEQTEYADHSIDLVCVAQALHWFDYDAFWPEVLRVLKPAGVFCALGYNLPSIDESVDALVEQYVLNIIDPYWAPQNQLLWNHYRDVRFPFQQIDHPVFSMTKRWNLDELFAFIHTFSATRRCMQDLGDDFFIIAYEKVKQAWGDEKIKRTADFDFVFYVGVNNN